MSSASSERVASHAGSWYTNDANKLRSQFDGWLNAVGALSVDSSKTRVRAIISPHAGYSYSGPTAAYGFKHMIPSDIKRVFILGPSHHHYTKICELSAHSTYATPLTRLTLDRVVIASLKTSKLFSDMSEQVDEEEHSIEMQLPFMAHVMAANTSYTIVPILVGALSTKAEAEFGALLAPYLENAENFFVISSDFCHWGSRFSFQHTFPSDESGKKLAIHESISKLDHQGMALIEKQDADGFASYLKQYSNTICGRHPIGILLRMLNATKNIKHNVKFLHYAQSSAVKSMSDSSVSYASAIVTADRS